LGISKNIFYNLISQVPQLLSGILVSILSTRILGPEGKGIFGIITYDIMFFGLLMGLGVNMAASFFIASKQTDAPKILGLGLYHLIR
jgi:O-antigen/teichoic acid export membrane protein